MEVLEIDVERPLDRGWDPTLYTPEVELARHTNHGQSENKPVGLGFHTVRRCINPDDTRVRPRVVGAVDVWTNSDPGM